MKFNVSSGHLLRTINTLSGIISTNSSMPILENFLFRLKGNNLIILASDLETTMSTTIEVEADTDGEIAVPARMLLDILKTFPEQALSFSIDKQSQLLEISYDQGSCDIPYEDVSEYPQAPTLSKTNETVITSDILLSAISKTLFATGNDDMRPVMSGVLFKFTPEGIIFVATDAHKLVKYEREDISSASEVEFIMPKKPLNLLKTILATYACDVLIKWSETNAMFEFEGTTLICRLIDGKFPNYEAVIPKENPNKLTVDRQLFLTTLGRVSLFANRTTNKIRLSLSDSEVIVSAEDTDLNKKATEKLPSSFSGEAMEIGFNSRFLIEMLKNIEGKDVSVDMSVPTRAGILKPLETAEGEKITMLVMPVMLNG